MHVKSNVRQRRQDRMKQIREQAPPRTPSRSKPDLPAPHAYGRAVPPDPVAPYAYARGPADLHDADKPAARREALSDPMLQDPEYVWKHRRELFGGPAADGDDEAPRAWLKPPGKRAIWVKLLLCAAIFGVVWEMFRLDTPWAIQGRHYITAALTEDFRFEEVAIWYERTFKGAPSFIPTFDDKKSGDPAEKVTAPLPRSFTSPVRGKIVADFSEQHPAVELETAPAAQVNAVDTGRVVFVGDKDGSGLTVVIQHAGQYQTVYGMLSESSVAKNDWIQGGEPVGKASKDANSALGRVYFAVSKNNQYVNPADVVRFE